MNQNKLPDFIYMCLTIKNRVMWHLSSQLSKHISEIIVVKINL